MPIKQKIVSESGLREAILELERKQNDDGKLLKKQFDLTVHSFKPINLIKSTFKDATAKAEVNDSIISTIVGLAAAYAAKIAIGSVTKVPLIKVLGSLTLFGITRVIARNPGVVRSLGTKLLGFIRHEPNTGSHTGNFSPNV